MADQIEVSAEDRAAAPRKAGRSRWGRRFLTLLIATAAVGGFAVVVLYSYEKTQIAGDNAAVPFVTAQKGPTKMRPREPGGMAVANLDKQVYGRLNIAEQPDTVERLLPPPEPVVRRPPPPPAASTAMAGRNAEETGKKLADIAPAAGNANPPARSAPPAPPAAPDRDGKARDGKARTADEPAQKSMNMVRLAAPPKKAAARPTPVFRIQLASLRSRQAAAKAWGQHKFDHASLFGELEPRIVKVDLKGKGTFYRLQAGPLENEEAARSLCTEVKKQKIGCIVVRP
jgi:hypothetical protein